MGTGTTILTLTIGTLEPIGDGEITGTGGGIGVGTITTTTTRLGYGDTTEGITTELMTTTRAIIAA